MCSGQPGGARQPEGITDDMVVDENNKNKAVAQKFKVFLHKVRLLNPN
jgi:hypothetical protein